MAENGTLGLLELLRQAGFAQSNGEARRLVQQNAVSLGGEKETDFTREIDLVAEAPFVLKVGKRRFVLLVHPGWRNNGSASCGGDSYRNDRIGH